MADILSLLLHGPLPARALMAQHGVSQATLSRTIAQNRQIMKFGNARATRYALLRFIREENAFPLWRVDETGRAHSAGTLWSVWPQGSYVLQNPEGEWAFYSGLPWFFNDMRPQGFLGGAWGRENAAQLSLSPDIRLWNEDQILIALTQNGYDMPGNGLIGNPTWQRWLTHQIPEVVSCAEKALRYPALAALALKGDEAGSSAGGEQPKFLCYTEDRGHCLVKFSSERDNENSQRWRDLLRAEHHALSLLAQQGIDAAQSQVTEANNQLFLEIARFDRIKQRGRRAMVSLEAVSAEFIGQLNHWPDALRRLAQAKLVDQETVNQGSLQWAFGRLIANSDMHAGNLSFFCNNGKLCLTPVYDMLPMALAPNSVGHMRNSVTLTIDFTLPRAIWQCASIMAAAYWQWLAEDEQFSEAFRAIARQTMQQFPALDATIAQMT